MILIYRPEKGDEQRWNLDEIKPTFAEAKAAEGAGDFKWKELRAELQDGNVLATQAVLWVLRKRAEPELRFADLESLPLDAVELKWSRDERALMRSLLKNDPNIGGDDNAVDAALALFAPTDDEGELDEPAPKEPAESESGTS